MTPTTPPPWVSVWSTRHFKLIEVFTVLDNIILGGGDHQNGLSSEKEARPRWRPCLSATD